jgi:nickel-dependent lactate racemase
MSEVIIAPKGRLTQEEMSNTPGKAIEATIQYLKSQYVNKIAIVVVDSTRGIDHKLVNGLYTHCRLIWTTKVVIANGAHKPKGPHVLGLDMSVVDHDAYDASQLEDLGTTKEGTPIIVNKALVEASHIIVVGLVKPHHFAGFSGGLKAVFPGCAGVEWINNNHKLKDEKGARFGVVTIDNPIRADIKESVAALKIAQVIDSRKYRKIIAIQAVKDYDDNFTYAHNISSSCEDLYDYEDFYQVVTDIARRVSETPVTEKFDRLIVHGEACESRDLYQCARWMAHAGPFLKEGGYLCLVANCREGLSVPSVVKKDTYLAGVGKYLPKDHHIHLVSQQLTWQENLQGTCIERGHYDLYSFLNSTCSTTCSIGQIEKAGLILPITQESQHD